MSNLKKRVILKEGQQPQLMSFEEVLIQFKPLVSRFVNKCVNMSKTQEKEDYIQIANMAIYECFRTYDEIHVFTTRLMIKLKGEVSRIASYDLANKRDKEVIVHSMDVTIDDHSIEEVIGDVDTEIDQLCENTVIGEIFKNLNSDEKEMYVHIIEGGMSVNKFAQMKGRSRQAMNYTYKKFTSKLHNLYINAISY